MQFKFTFKHMDSSEAVRDYAENKLREKIEKFVTKPIEVITTFSVDRHNHRAMSQLVAGDNFNVQVEATSEDMYVSIDKMAVKLETQLKKHKEKLKDHKNQPKLSNVTPPPVLDPENRDPDDVEVDAADLLKFEESKRANG